MANALKGILLAFMVLVFIAFGLAIASVSAMITTFVVGVVVGCGLTFWLMKK